MPVRIKDVELEAPIRRRGKGDEAFMDISSSNMTARMPDLFIIAGLLPCVHISPMVDVPVLIILFKFWRAAAV